jgi:hypothetical protein
MRLLSKLSNLLKAVARGPASRQRDRKEAALPDAPSQAPFSVQSSDVERESNLEEGRVADLLRSKLTAPDADQQQREKGD